MQAEEVQQTSNSINIRNSAIVMDSDYVFIIIYLQILVHCLVRHRYCHIMTSSSLLGHSSASNQGVAEGKYHDLGIKPCWMVADSVMLHTGAVSLRMLFLLIDLQHPSNWKRKEKKENPIP